MDVPNQLGDFIEDHNVNRRRAAFSPINGDLPQLSMFPQPTNSNYHVVSLQTRIRSHRPEKKEAEQKKIEKIETKKRKDELKKQKKTTTKAQNKKSKKNNRSAKTAKQRKVSSSEDESEEEGDTPCMYCEEVYSGSIEGWISCSLCGRWAHISCAGIDDDDDEAIHICEFCQVK
ncbi:hypothetical protein HW555_012941 [Spodoptera exigua]|uniref:Zinc finger PHD-type domain-containing protein n=1 Tax=Spodoptera exigua TaxID=7107 RepID=A0A835L087_SPOEX|nr:hypothetical protein HW555_012941 [Spodoptera exigua]